MLVLGSSTLILTLVPTRNPSQPSLCQPTSVNPDLVQTGQAGGGGGNVNTHDNQASGQTSVGIFPELEIIVELLHTNNGTSRFNSSSGYNYPLEVRTTNLGPIKLIKNRGVSPRWGIKVLDISASNNESIVNQDFQR